MSTIVVTNSIPVSPTSSRWWSIPLTPVGLLMLTMSMVVVSTGWCDNDTFWHLGVGRLMVEDGRFPNPDPFSWSMRGGSYIAYSAQVDRLYYLLWQFGGAAAIGIFFTVCYGLALLPVAWRLGQLRLRPGVEAIALFVVAWALAPYRGSRPHLIAFVIFGLIAWQLQRPFGARRILVTGVCLGVWANLHGSFQVGFALVGAAVFAWAWARDWTAVRGAVVSLGVGLGISGLSPYGFELWLYPSRTVSNPYMKLYNSDWSGLMPLDVNLAVGLILLAALGVGVWKATDPRSVGAFGLVLPMVQVGRFSPFEAPLLAVLTVERLVERYPHLQQQRAVNERVIRAVTLVMVIAAAIFIVLTMPRQLERAAQHPLPQPAVDKLLQCGQPAPMWNNYNWGGYLIWRGGGQYQVGMDGRAETLYSNKVIDDYYKVNIAAEGWKAIVQDAPVKYALMYADAPAKIESLSGWRIRYSDDVASLIVRDDAHWNCRQEGGGA